MSIEIHKQISDDKAVLTLSGRLDSYSFAETEKTIIGVIGQNKKVVLDFLELSYISSEGLRALLNSQKAANEKRAEMTICNVNNDVMKILRMTGFSNFLTIIEGRVI